MKFAIYGVRFYEQAKDYIQLLFDELKKHQCELVIYSDLAEALEINIDLKNSYTTFRDYEDLEKDEFDFMITIGGDGTILSAATIVRDLGIPILGINTGRLGFLANISKHHIQKTLFQLKKGRYKIEERTLIAVQNMQRIFGELNFAVNEITINRKDTTSMISVKVCIDGKYLNTYWADGLIISTPTGSTGYSLSCGGPIIMPGSKNLVITPIAPHNLNVRPLVIDDGHELTVHVQGREEEYLIGLDSRIYSVSLGAEIKLKKSDVTLKMVELEDHDYPSTLRNKLLWGLDRRN
ncbi:MAG: NAD kinase [Flavobacteriales bacterium]|jgi:NAD+ kinase|nr:NAD kinase [Flavobacteriales bacterium]